MTEPNPRFLVGVLCHKKAPNNKLITVVHLTFGRARINLGCGSGATYDSGW